MAKRSKNFGYAAIVAASVGYACGGSGGSNGGDEGCALYEAPKSKLVRCNDSQDTVLQWKEAYCGATPAGVCSMYFYGDLNHGSDYPDATVEESTDEGVEGLPVPACVCDYGNVVNNSCINGQNQGGTPTTGASDDEDTGNVETGADTDPTGGPEPEMYICLKADEKCAKINYVLSPLLDDWSECWSDPPPCVEANDPNDAITQCEKKCTDRQGEIATEVSMFNMDVDNADDEVIKSPLDCKYGDDPPADRPRVALKTDTCTPPAKKDVLPVWGGETSLYAYSGRASLTDVTGGSAQMDNMWGYLAYETYACDKHSCTIRFDAIEGLADDLSGAYTDATGGFHRFSFAELDMRLVQAVEGVYYPAEGAIEFSGVPFAFMLGTREVRTDFSTLGKLETVAVATSASGHLSASGELTLTLNYAGTYGSGTLTLNTH